MGLQPTASFTHFLVKLFLAAPKIFFSTAAASQAAAASFSHFFMNEFLAAPASFFSVDAAVQLAPSAARDASGIRAAITTAPKQSARMEFSINEKIH
jgi:hypothetical protein